MKVAFVTDSHFDLGSRWEETVRIHNWIADDAAARGCTLTLLGGDLHERKSVAAERNAVAEWLVRMAELGEVVGVYGNHEAPLDLDLYNQLEARHAITFHSRPAVHVADGLAIACMPWPRKAQLLALLGEVSQEQAGQAALAALQNVFRGLGQELAQHKLARLFLGHAHVRSSRVSTGQPLAPGADFEIGLDDLALVRAQIYLLGHIHDGVDNEWLIEKSPCLYGGSPRRTSYGELEQKGYVVAEFDGRRLVRWERVPTPCAPMLLLTGTYFADHELDVVGMENAATLQGAEIRLRVDVPPDQREAARAAMAVVRDRLLAAGALNVKLEEQVAIETRSRAPEVARAITLVEKLDAFWHAKSFDPGERRAGLVSKVQVVEEEVRNAG